MRLPRLHIFRRARVSIFVGRYPRWGWLLCLPMALAGADLTALLAGIENRYNRAQTLQADFEQSYRGQGRGWKPERGRLWLRKPGKMRWEYSDPPGKLFLTDGRFAWLYTPESNQAERTRIKETEDLRAPLAFLLGRLDFQRDFRRFISRADGADHWIEAEPKSDRAVYSQVEFLVTPEFQIRRLRITGQDRSVMEFRFENERLNAPLEERLFQFRPPPGAVVIESSQ